MPAGTSHRADYTPRIAPDATIQEAAATLLKHRVSRLPVTDPDGVLLGILSTTDVMKVITSDPEACGIA